MRVVANNPFAFYVYSSYDPNIDSVDASADTFGKCGVHSL